MAFGLWLLVSGFSGWALAALAMALGAASAADRAMFWGRRAPRRIEIRSDGSACVMTADGAALQAERGARRAGRWWAIVQLTSRRRRHLLITAGMLTGEDLRRLRLWVLWGRHGAGAMSAPGG